MRKCLFRIVLTVLLVFVLTVPLWAIVPWMDWIGEEVKVVLSSGGGYGEDHIIARGIFVRYDGLWILIEEKKYLRWCYIPNIAYIELKKT